jgi:8-oxo-dGTP diphosphatase
LSSPARSSADGHVLLARRPEARWWLGVSAARSAGETPDNALIREMRNSAFRSGISASRRSLSPATLTFHLLMPLFVCRRWDGEINASRGQELVRKNRLGTYPMPPADLPPVDFADWL